MKTWAKWGKLQPPDLLTDKDILFCPSFVLLKDINLKFKQDGAKNSFTSII